MKKSTLIFNNFWLIIFISIGFHSYSQKVIRCYTNEMHELLMQQNPELEKQEDFENWMSAEIQKQHSMAIKGGVYSIPVVVHVIHNGEAVGTGSNVSFAAIQSQINVLNEDFRKMANTRGWNTHPDGADTQIEFCLALRRPDGSAFPTGEPGVNRINRTTAGFTAPPYSSNYVDATIKAYTYNNNTPTSTRGWDPSKYMNIWLADLSGGLLGYAQFPQSPLGGMGCGAGSISQDGVVFLYNSIGKSAVTGFAGPYNEGRTATHEIGHWLGLRHIWGDGNCTATDYCADTPPAASSNSGCPTGRNSCTTAPDAGPDMIENYMDYTDDLCMNIFTNDQKMRMRTVLENSPRRVSLINSDACNPPNQNDASIVDVTNPKGDNCAGSIAPVATLKNRGSSNLTSATISYNIDNGTPTTFAWTGSLTPGATTNITLPTFTAPLGQHLIKAYSTLPNGAPDPSTAYDTSGISFTISNGTNAPYSENFDTGIFPPDIRWVVDNVNNDCFEWIGASGTSISGTVSNNIAQLPAFGNSTGSTESLLTPIFILPCNATAANLKFDLAYKRKTTTSNERLYVDISTDCGNSWNSTAIYDKAGATLATVTATTATEYYPAAAADWRTETIDLTSFVSATSKNIKFRFRAVTANGNNLFIDNIKFNATTPGEINVTQSTTNVLDEGFYNFTTTPISGSTTATFTITNTGTSNLTLTNPINVTGAGFSLGSSFGTTTVAAGGTTTFSVVFNPSTSGNFTGNVSFGTNDCDESTFNFQLQGLGAIVPAVADFSASQTTICAGSSITFTNLSTGATSYSWSIGGGTPSTSTDLNPVVTFSTPGTYTIALTASNANSSNVKTKTNYITVLSATGQNLPFTEGFTSATFPPTGWSVINLNNSVTWVRSTTGNTANSMMFDNYNVNDSDDDQVRLPGLNFQGYSSVQMKFDVAYAAYNGTYFDGLAVLISTDCGQTFNPTTYSKTNSTIATGNLPTAAATTNSFTPTANQWRTETLDLSSYIGNPKVVLAFKNLSGNGNRLFIDNINITGVAQTTPPTASFTVPTQTICAGTSITLTNTSTGNPSSYAWTINGGTPSSSTIASPTATFATAGTYTISMTATNAAGSNTATQTIVVNATPTVSTNNQTICAGQSATLTAVPSTSGGTFLWSNGVNTVTNTVTPTANANYTVVYTLNGCSSSAATAAVTVNPTPIVSVTNQTICAGSTATLTASSTTPGGIYTWSNGANTASINVNPTTTTTYTVSYTANNCPSSNVTATVTVNSLPTVTVNNPTICSGQSTNISATASTSGGTFSWNGGGIGNSISVTPQTTTTYTVTYTLPGCSQVTANGTVTVNASPIISATNITICSGQTATIKTTSSPSGGIYTWTPGGSNSSSDSLVVSPLTNTTYTVSYLVNGCTATAAALVTVNQKPLVVANDQTICLGGTATLTATSNINGTIFSWSNGATTSSTAVSPNSNTSYTVIGTSNGCVSQIDTVHVTMTPAPTVNVNNATICSGSSATLTAIPSLSGGNFSWSNNSNGTSIIVNPLTSTSYTVTYSLSGCPNATATALVTVNPSPNVNAGLDTIVCQSNLPITLNATSTNSGVSFIWSNGSTSASTLITTGGTYTVTGTLNNCSTTDAVVVSIDPCAELNENEISYSLYPNPTNDVFNIKSSSLTSAEIELLNVEGKIIVSDRLIGNTKTINLSNFENGLYIIKIRDNKKSTILRVIKQ